MLLLKQLGCKCEHVCVRSRSIDLHAQARLGWRGDIDQWFCSGHKTPATLNSQFKHNQNKTTDFATLHRIGKGAQSLLTKFSGNHDTNALERY